MDRDTFLSAEEARTFGIIDGVLAKREHPPPGSVLTPAAPSTPLAADHTASGAR
jgi:hypothetical protein